VPEHGDYYSDRAERYDRLYQAVIAPSGPAEIATT